MNINSNGFYWKKIRTWRFCMINRVHILGAAGSGTTTLAKALSKEISYKFLDTDDYFWMPSEVQFTEKRAIQDRQLLLRKDLEQNKKWILSGSLCGWGDIFIPYFELVVYLWIPNDTRMSRLAKREQGRYGSEIEPNGSRYQLFNEFMDWASKYDDAGIKMRSRKLHDLWLSKLDCPVLKLEGDMTVDERLYAVLNIIKKSN